MSSPLGYTIHADSIGEVWEQLVESLLEDGQPVSPRAYSSRELVGMKVRFPARENLLVNGVRKLSYRFAVAEWLWIWYGHEDVATISRYNRHIAQFSDDNVIFNGSYGPRLKARWGPSILKLLDDPDTRQAVMPIFGQAHSYSSKDVPCTLTFQLLRRQDKLHGIVNMRSSDVWLGLPYDAFNFSQLLLIAAAQVGVPAGTLEMNLASSHLYDRDREAAIAAVKVPTLTVRSPHNLLGPPGWLDEVLVGLDVAPEYTEGKEPWTTYAKVLRAETQGVALELLRSLS